MNRASSRVEVGTSGFLSIPVFFRRVSAEFEQESQASYSFYATRKTYVFDGDYVILISLPLTMMLIWYKTHYVAFAIKRLLENYFFFEMSQTFPWLPVS